MNVISGKLHEAVFRTSPTRFADVPQAERAYPAVKSTMPTAAAHINALWVSE
jgi:hypothetical protein